MTQEETKKWLEDKHVKFKSHLGLLLPALYTDPAHEHAKEIVEVGGSLFITRLHSIMHDTNPCKVLNGEMESCKASIQHFEWRMEQIEIEKERLKCK
ncbi:hypothetical protein CNR22_03700 [Sphingobacteriaceae bacterium]|nr:hypothetical protein CNR22_03700 [Sphingobacteriaceae bacterium]